MKRTKRQILISILLSNTGALLVFYLMYKGGISLRIPLVQQYYIVPLVLLVAYLIKEDYKEIRASIPKPY